MSIYLDASDASRGEKCIGDRGLRHANVDQLVRLGATSSLREVHAGSKRALLQHDGLGDVRLSGFRTLVDTRELRTL